MQVEETTVNTIRSTLLVIAEALGRIAGHASALPTSAELLLIGLTTALYLREQRMPSEKEVYAWLRVAEVLASATHCEFEEMELILARLKREDRPNAK